MPSRLDKTYPPVKTVSGEEHQGMVREIFATIPRHYDLLNRVLSLNLDVYWRRFAVSHMRFFATHRLLDLATGTADVAIAAALQYPRIQVTALDFVREMMAVGVPKIAKDHLTDRISLLQADATSLPLADNRFDAASMAFGIRNIPERLKVLKEMTRVVIPGGRVLVLEMHYPEQPLFQGIYRLYLNLILPSVARIFSRNPGAYRYLSDSIIHFPNPSAFAQLMSDAGLTEIRRYPLTLGATYLHVGIKP